MWSNWWNENKQEKLKCFEETCPVPFRPPQVLHDLTWIEPKLLQWEASN
jgi:hypothetical protein